MGLILEKVEVGPWPMNSYLVIDEATRQSIIVDPGADAEKILAAAGGTEVQAILLTHGHPDHVGALREVRRGAGQPPVYIHPADADRFDVYFDAPLADGQVLKVGASELTVIHTPGHTPGMVCLDLGDGRIVVGDTLFVDGPGRTWSAADFATTMHTMQTIVFEWPEETRFYPGHGPSGVIGDEQPKFDAFVQKGWEPDTQGDITWK